MAITDTYYTCYYLYYIQLIHVESETQLVLNKTQILRAQCRKKIMQIFSAPQKTWTLISICVMFKHFSSSYLALSIFPIPLCSLLLQSHEALSGITSTVTQRLHNDLNLTSRPQCLHTDKAPQASLSALSTTSVIWPWRYTAWQTAQSFSSSRRPELPLS